MGDCSIYHGMEECMEYVETDRKGCILRKCIACIETIHIRGVPYCFSNCDSIFSAFRRGVI